MHAGATARSAAATLLAELHAPEIGPKAVEDVLVRMLAPAPGLHAEAHGDDGTAAAAAAAPSGVAGDDD